MSTDAEIRREAVRLGIPAESYAALLRRGPSTVTTTTITTPASAAPASAWVDDDAAIAAAIKNSLLFVTKTVTIETKIETVSLKEVSGEDVSRKVLPVKLGEQPEVDGVRCRLQDHGVKAGDHTNMCLYLSACEGDQNAALKLKAKLAPRANQIARGRREITVDFSAKSCMAEEEVVWAYPLVAKRNIIVVNENTGVAELYSHGDNLGAPARVLLRGAHFFELIRV